MPDEPSKAEELFCAVEGLWHFLELDLLQVNNLNILLGDHDDESIGYDENPSQQHPQMTSEVVTTQGLYRKNLGGPKRSSRRKKQTLSRAAYHVADGNNNFQIAIMRQGRVT